MDKVPAASDRSASANAGALIEYTFIDHVRLRSYVDQIQSTHSGRSASPDHVMIQVLLEHLSTHNQLATYRPDDCDDHWRETSRPFVRERMEASKAIIPVPPNSKVKGLRDIAVWVSDPPSLTAPKNSDAFSMDREGTFVYLIESYWEHNEDYPLSATTYGWAASGYSALMWIMDELVRAQVVAMNLREQDRYGGHPLDRLQRLGARVLPKRRIDALYRKRLISDNAAIDFPKFASSSPHKTTRREFNDVVGYPIFIAGV